MSENQNYEKKVVILESDPSHLRLQRRLLETKGHKVIGCVNGQELSDLVLGLNGSEKDHGAGLVVINEHVRDGGDLRHLATKIKERYPSLEVYFRPSGLKMHGMGFLQNKGITVDYGILYPAKFRDYVSSVLGKEC